MNKEKIFITLWALTLLCPLLVMFFMYSDLNLIVVFSSLTFKSVLGMLGFYFATKNWEKFKEDCKLQKKPLIPFYILAVIVIQIILITVIMVFISSSGDIASGSGYAFGIGLYILFILAGTYCWEVEFLKTIENSIIRLAFAVSTPLLLFTSEIIVLILIMGL